MQEHGETGRGSRNVTVPAGPTRRPWRGCGRRVMAENRNDRVIERVVVGRLSLEPSVADALCRVAEADDD